MDSIFLKKGFPLEMMSRYQKREINLIPAELTEIQRIEKHNVIYKRRQEEE